MASLALGLRRFERCHLPQVVPWFHEAETQRWLGGPGWPQLVIDLEERPLGEFRGARETGRYGWLALADDAAVGYTGCDTYDRWTTWNGRGVFATIPVPAATISPVVDPAVRRRGIGTAVITAMIALPELAPVALVTAGIEPANTASARCLQKAGFQPLNPDPDVEGVLRPVHGSQGRRTRPEFDHHRPGHWVAGGAGS